MSHRCPTCGGPVAIESSEEGTHFYVSVSAKPKSSKKPCALPDDWMPTDAHRERAVLAGLSCVREAEKFRAHAEANDRRQVNWNAAFTTWLMNAEEWNNARQPKPKADPYAGHFIPRHRGG